MNWRLQVNNREKFPFVQYLSKNVADCKFVKFKLFDRIVNKRDFLKIINLYSVNCQ